MKTLLILVLGLVISLDALCQLDSSYVDFKKSFPDTINPLRFRKVKRVTLGATLLGLGGLSYVWYHKANSAPFHYYNDWQTHYQLDKFSHAFACYHMGQKGYHALRWAGFDRKKAIWYGGISGFVAWLPVEIFDGLHDRYGFSPTDVAANGVGTVLFISQQLIFDEQLIKMKFSFWPTDYKQYNLRYQRKGRITFAGHLNDYNAQTYWFAIGLHKFIKPVPPWLNLSVGFSAKGMRDNNVDLQGNPLPPIDTYRQTLLSIDIDLTKIKTRSRFLKKVFNELNILKIPAPTLEYNQLNGWKFRPLYW